MGLGKLPTAWGQLIVDIEQALKNTLDGMQGEVPRFLLQAMRYALLGGGKRLRPLLLLLSAKACHGRVEDAMPWACAVEMLHAYSLVHDDLPAMDNDLMRRGLPTTHCAFGEGMAILVGDALLTEAWALLVKGTEKANWPADRGLLAVGDMVRYAGAQGMVAGQVKELWSPQSDEEWDEVYALKTGSLFALSARLGARAADAPPPVVHALTRFGISFGSAFQVHDDLMDGNHPFTEDDCDDRIFNLCTEAYEVLETVGDRVDVEFLRAFPALVGS
ncbi:polyprenyl synthetase family protein [Pasteuria penetrans]|uniref:polyprenyl synthetase family protein n=1 Tax=Pasteuria penetrans TaxID=86005 RepID=UPI000FB83C58|nr:polyprenyl synthetase family protein [Pasteuria penetrans]